MEREALRIADDQMLKEQSDDAHPKGEASVNKRVNLSGHTVGGARPAIAWSH
jgi:putative IMPACT (imprinted ancient) family translation regulator